MNIGTQCIIPCTTTKKLILLESAFMYLITLSVIIILTIILMMMGTKSIVYGAEFVANHDSSGVSSSSVNINDFRINNFGTDSHRNIFLNVIGHPGASMPTNSEQLFSYLFFTNNGVYAVSVSEDPSSIENAARITLDKNNCISSSHNIGKTDIHGNILTIGLIPFSSSSVLSTLAIHKVETVQFNIDDTGTCIVNVFDSVTS